MTDITRGFYRHFKGEIYFVEGIVQDVTNTNQFGDEPTMMVLYHKMLTPENLIVREISEFTASVHEDGTDCFAFDAERCELSQPRFVRMEEKSQQAEMRQTLLETKAMELMEERMKSGIVTPDDLRKFFRMGFDGPEDD